MNLVIHTDGGARGNPGPAAIGIVISDQNGKTIKEFGTYIGETTNNEAEYRALIAGLEEAVEKKAAKAECYLDSELVVKQLNGQYRVKNERMQILHSEVKELMQKIPEITFTHVKREKNKDADRLVNQVLDSLTD